MSVHILFARRTSVFTREGKHTESKLSVQFHFVRLSAQEKLEVASTEVHKQGYHSHTHIGKSEPVALDTPARSMYSQQPNCAHMHSHTHLASGSIHHTEHVKSSLLASSSSGLPQTLLVWCDAFLVLDLGLDIVNGEGFAHLSQLLPDLVCCGTWMVQ